MRHPWLLPGLLLLPLTAHAASWRVVAEESSLGFRGTQAGMGFDGVFPVFDAAIEFDPARLDKARVAVTIDMTRAESGSAERDGALRQADWFDVARYPQARFAATTFRDLGNGHYEARGALTLKGVTRPVVLPFTLKIDGATARMDGGLTLDRHHFKVGEGQWASDQWVAREVVVTVKLTAQEFTKE